MDVDRPDSTETNESNDRFQRKAKDEGGKVDQAHRVNRVERMLAMGGQPVEMFGTVMHRMESPKKADAMLQTVSPINKEITQDHHFNHLEPPRLRGDILAEAIWNKGM